MCYSIVADDIDRMEELSIANHRLKTARDSVEQYLEVQITKLDNKETASKSD